MRMLFLLLDSFPGMILHSFISLSCFASWDLLWQASKFHRNPSASWWTRLTGLGGGIRQKLSCLSQTAETRIISRPCVGRALQPESEHSSRVFCRILHTTWSWAVNIFTLWQTLKFKEQLLLNLVTKNGFFFRFNSEVNVSSFYIWKSKFLQIPEVF